MMVWPEGRMEFVCTAPAEEGKKEQRWLGEVMVKSHSMGMAELIIYGRDSCINAVIGKYMSGQYIWAAIYFPVSARSSLSSTMFMSIRCLMASYACSFSFCSHSSVCPTSTSDIGLVESNL